MKIIPKKYCRRAAFLLTLFLFFISSAVISDCQAETGKDTAAMVQADDSMKQGRKAFKHGHFTDAVNQRNAATRLKSLLKKSLPFPLIYKDFI